MCIWFSLIKPSRRKSSFNADKKKPLLSGHLQWSSCWSSKISCLWLAFWSIKEMYEIVNGFSNTCWICKIISLVFPRVFRCQNGDSCRAGFVILFIFILYLCIYKMTWFLYTFLSLTIATRFSWCIFLFWRMRSPDGIAWFSLCFLHWN